MRSPVVLVFPEPEIAASEAIEVKRAARYGVEGEVIVGIGREPEREVGPAGELHAPYALVGDLLEEATRYQAADRAPCVGAVGTDRALELGEGDPVLSLAVEQEHRLALHSSDSPAQPAASSTSRARRSTARSLAASAA